MFLEYKEEILSIARFYKVTTDIALDMFISNIEKGEDCREHAYFYSGMLADKLDYNILKAEYDNMSVNDRIQARNEFCDSLSEC